MKLATVILIAIGAVNLNADSFNQEHSANNESFDRTMSKNKANLHVGGASYTEVNGKDEFKEALKSGELGSKVNTNKITKTFKTIDIKNVRMNKNDFKDIDKKGILIGSKISKNREKLVQTISIKNSKISTDKQLNIGVISTNCRVKGVKNTTNIDHSSFKGGYSHKRRRDNKKSRLDDFEDF
jgi:hypothetical protein